MQRVKILFNKKDSALVQMREPAQAQLGKTLGILYEYFFLCSAEILMVIFVIQP